METILLSRYAVPSEEQVVEYLIKKTREVDSIGSIELPGAVAQANIRNRRSELEQRIMGLPDSIRRHIIAKQESCMEFVRRNTLAPVITEGEPGIQILQLQYGIIPKQIIDRAQKKGEVNDAGWYRNAFSHQSLKIMRCGEMWSRDLNLGEEGLRERVHTDKTSKIMSNTNYTPEEMGEVLEQVKTVTDFVYENFSTPVQVAELTDVSEEVREKLTLQPVVGLHEYINAKRIEEAISQTV